VLVPLTFGIGSDTLGGLTHFFVTHGLPLLFVVIMLESFGIPLPGETALVAFGVLASQGHYSIVWVIVLAAAGAIIGDNLGYWLLGRLGGRALFRKWAWLERYSDRVIPRVERLMHRHGGKTVFFGRFIAVLRVGAAAVAGLAHMPWWRFLFWNATGGIVWATSVGLAAYYGGHAVADAIQTYGLYAFGGIAVVLVGGWFVLHNLKKRVEKAL
jgi:membrane protein DedA with SNARE-associated domain